MAPGGARMVVWGVGREWVEYVLIGHVCEVGRAD